VNLRVFDVFPNIITPRLCLRAISLDDTQAYYKMLKNEAVVKYYGLYPISSDDFAKWLIERYQIGFKEMKYIRWSITDINTQAFMGTCGYQSMNEFNSKAEISYDLAPEYWHRAYMTEAIFAILQWGFDEFGLNRVEAMIYPGNIASEKLILRLGFKKEGLLREYAYFRDTYTDLNLFSLLKKEFLNAESFNYR